MEKWYTSGTLWLSKSLVGFKLIEERSASVPTSARNQKAMFNEWWMCVLFRKLKRARKSSMPLALNEAGSQHSHVSLIPTCTVHYCWICVVGIVWFSELLDSQFGVRWTCRMTSMSSVLNTQPTWTWTSPPRTARQHSRLLVIHLSSSQLVRNVRDLFLPVALLSKSGAFFSHQARTP